MGHVRKCVWGDAFARHFRKSNFNILHPIGWDSFGMPAENAAIKHKLHQKMDLWKYWLYEKWVKSLGFIFSEIESLQQVMNFIQNGEQEFIIKMYEAGIIYRKSATVGGVLDLTVLTNEQLEDGCCWRCGTQVVQKRIQDIM